MPSGKPLDWRIKMAWYISLIVLLTLALIAYVREKGQRRTRPVSGGKQSDVNLPYEKDIELYANPFSHCSRKVTLAMEEYELDYAYHNVHLIADSYTYLTLPTILRLSYAVGVRLRQK